MRTTLLIDADIIAYQFASNAQEDFKWGDGVESQSLRDVEAVIKEVDFYLIGLTHDLDAEDFIICLSDKNNFRKSVLPTYKANRKDVVKPVLLQATRSHLETYTHFTRPSLEADDVMGILSTSATVIKGKKIIVSIDKDMRTIPGFLYNPNKGVVEEITATEADVAFYKQVLTGDATDGYSGCPGIGPVKAEKILNEACAGKTLDASGLSSDVKRAFWRSIASAYETKGLTDADALVQARVARICRAEDYDFKKKEVRLWNPY